MHEIHAGLFRLIYASQAFLCVFDSRSPLACYWTSSTYERVSQRESFSKRTTIKLGSRPIVWPKPIFINAFNQKRGSVTWLLLDGEVSEVYLSEEYLSIKTATGCNQIHRKRLFPDIRTIFEISDIRLAAKPFGALNLAGLANGFEEAGSTPLFWLFSWTYLFQCGNYDVQFVGSTVQIKSHEIHWKK